MKNIKKIEKISEYLIEIDKYGADYRITKNEFVGISSNEEIIAGLTGKQNIKKDWNEFKEQVIKYQEEFGFFWKKSQGQFGTIILEKIELPYIIGNEIAKRLIADRIKEGDFNDIIDKYLPTLKCYLSKNNFDFSNFGITSAKNKFSETVVNNQRYKFTTRSFSFELGIEQYTYKGKTRKIKVELGEKLFKSGKLKELLKLDFIPHQQEKRKYKKYQNVDFEGFRIIKQISSDEIEIINVELKPSNKIEYVSDAISQAVNYKESANKTYIAIPLFDPKSFYDADRFQNFIRLCEENELGIISININPESHEILGLDIILNAKKRELVRHDRANELLEQDGKIYCPLCHRIVSNDNNRTRCGWSVEIGDNTKCMKQIMENSMINQKLNNEQEK